MCNISLNLDDKMVEEVTGYAQKVGMTVEQYIKHLINEDLEDKYDAECADQAYAEYLANPVTVTMDEVAKKYGFK